MKNIYIIMTFVIPFLLLGCGRTESITNIYEHQGKVYIKGEVEPYTGTLITDGGGWTKTKAKYVEGKRVSATGYYKNGNIRYKNKGLGGPSTYFDPDGNPLSPGEYTKNKYYDVE